MFGIDDVLGIGAGVYGAIEGNKQQKKANQLSAQALAQSQQQYDANAPFRALGKQQLGHAEQAYDMGNHSYNPTNPFAAARGPTQSNAYITGTANNTFEAPLEQPTFTGPKNADDSQRMLLTAVFNNKQLPVGVREKAGKQLGAMGPASTAPTGTTYGFGAK